MKLNSQEFNSSVDTLSSDYDRTVVYSDMVVGNCR